MLLNLLASHLNIQRHYLKRANLKQTKTITLKGQSQKTMKKKEMDPRPIVGGKRKL